MEAFVHPCPVCSGNVFQTVVTAEELQQECRIREHFVEERLAAPAKPEERKDLTDFFHGGDADILQCGNCSLLVRHEHEAPPAQDYSEDDYDPRLMDRLYPQYLDAFRAKEKPYRHLLPEGSKVLEVGSHYGAFLQTASEWGWRAEGVDVGRDTSRFATSKGFLVHAMPLEQCAFRDASFHGVFIWNCFEQIEEPAATLETCRRVLKPGGLLVVRTPNGLFYTLSRQLMQDATVNDGSKTFLLDALAYNNLLGFPYLYGHSNSTLQRLIEPYGFTFSGLVNSELLTLPLPQSPAWVNREERTINEEIRLLANSILAGIGGTAVGPWVELSFRVRR